MPVPVDTLKKTQSAESKYGGRRTCNESDIPNYVVGHTASVGRFSEFNVLVIGIKLSCLRRISA